MAVSSEPTSDFKPVNGYELIDRQVDSIGILKSEDNRRNRRVLLKLMRGCLVLSDS